MKTIIIVAMTRNRVIGRDGRIPWHDSDDLKHFKRVTTGHTVIMGRRTFESIGRPLPGRRNIVLTRGGKAETAGGEGVEGSRGRGVEGGKAEIPKRGNAEVTEGQDAETGKTAGGESASGAMSATSLSYARSLDEALRLCCEREEEKAFIIGGGQIYAQALPLADEMIVTWIDGEDIGGDTFFPEWGSAEWIEAPPADPSFSRAITYHRSRP